MQTFQKMIFALVCQARKIFSLINSLYKVNTSELLGKYYRNKRRR